MLYLKNLYVLILVTFVFFGCSIANRAGNTTDQTTAQTDTTTEKNKDGFISTPVLSDTEIDNLWQVVIDTCYDLNYSVTFNDRKTKNISCQTETQGRESTYTMRVKFSDKGILIDTKSNSMGNFILGGAATKMDTQKMQTALEAKLREIKVENPSVAAPSIIKRSDSNREAASATNIIYQAQVQLSKLKYNPGPADGSMGKKTRNAIMSFQKDNNLIVSGNLDDATLSKLNELSAK